MRHLGTFCCGLTLCLALSGVLQAQVFKPAPVGGGGFQLGPVGGGISGGLGNSGFNGVGTGSVTDFDMKSRLPDIGPVPEIQHHGTQQAISTHDTYTTSQHTQDVAAVIEPMESTQENDDKNQQLDSYVIPSEPPEEEDPDDDDSEEGSPWWLWLLIALAVVGIVVKSRR
jgi:hypothetical protein